MRSVDLVGIQMELTSGAPVLLLREHDAPHRVLPIFVGGAEAASIALAASGQALARPLTHDLMASLVETLDGHLDAVEVTEVRDGTFLANLSLRGPGGRHRVDTRPSDAIALAVRLGAPLFVSDDVLEQAGTILPEPDDTLPPEQIDAEVDRFREFLGELDPADFLDAGRPSGVIETELIDTELIDTELIDTELIDTELIDTDPAGTDPVDTDDADRPESTDSDEPR